MLAPLYYDAKMIEMSETVKDQARRTEARIADRLVALYEAEEALGQDPDR